MKKVIMLLGFILLITGNLFANEQQLVGSWTSLHNSDVTITFNANGTVSVSGDWNSDTRDWHGDYAAFRPTHWAAAGDRISLFIPNGHRASRFFRISTDGRTFIISAVEGDIRLSTPFRRN